MTSSISRGPITSAILVVMGALNFPVGDNSRPTDPYGWQGEPNSGTSTFIPWLELSSGLGSPQSRQAMGDTGVDWKLNYNVYFAGISRTQTDALADKIRELLLNMARSVVSTPSGDWRFMKVSVTGIGSSARIPSVYPDYYTQSDAYEVWMTKN